MAKRSKQEMAASVVVTGIGWANCEQACVYANISMDTLRRWFDDGLKHCRIGGLVRIRYSDIDTHIEKHAVNNVDASPGRPGDVKAKALRVVHSL